MSAHSMPVAAALARKVFAKRGDRSEAHITEPELAAIAAVAFERGEASVADQRDEAIAALQALFTTGSIALGQLEADALGLHTFATALGVAKSALVRLRGAA